MEIFTYFMIGFFAKDMYTWLRYKLEFIREIGYLEDLWVDDTDTEFEEEI
tara:strand:- start:1262 stop:1411 length:150 start_codon:yes stop_codon:yes gene_type:complete